MKTNDLNKTESVSAQGPLSETLKAMDNWDMNELNDPVAYGKKNIKDK